MKACKVNYIKLYIELLLVLVLLIGVFYWAAGEQLFYRVSKGNQSEIYGNGTVLELVDDLWIDQFFIADMDRLDSVGVLVSANGNTPLADVYTSVWDITDNRMLMERTIRAEEIGNNQYFYMSSDSPVVGIRGHQLRINMNAKGGVAGSTAVGVFDSERKVEGCDLLLRGVWTEGSFCYSLQGYDDVWTGHVYFKWALYLIGIVTLVYVICAVRFEKGKREFLFQTFFILKKYKFLIQQIVGRDFKVKYKRSVLGVLWSFLNPLLTMVIQYIVFSQLFRADVDNFPVYLLAGSIIFNFFNEAVGLSIGAIVGNASLITKVYVPKYIYPVTRVLSSLINLLISMIPLLIAILVTHEQITKAYFLIPIVLICVLVFTMGIGMLLSALMVFFRDIQFLWGLLSMLWMYATPLFYPENIIPAQYKFLHNFNPMYYYVKAFRTIIMDGISPEPKMYVLCAFMALLSLGIGAFVFKKTQDQFALNI